MREKTIKEKITIVAKAFAKSYRNTLLQDIGIEYNEYFEIYSDRLSWIADALARREQLIYRRLGGNPPNEWQEWSEGIYQAIVKEADSFRNHICNGCKVEKTTYLLCEQCEQKEYGNLID